jgi:hypothetical protein
MAGHLPFGAQIILNGHEYVACHGRKRRLTFTEEANCFTQLRVTTSFRENCTVGTIRSGRSVPR